MRSGERTVNKAIQQAVQRQENDLKRQRTKDFPYYFDEQEAERILQIVKLHRHTKGEYKGRFFDLQPFQAFFFAVLYGWRKTSTHKRRFTKAYLQMPRKGGKSEVAAVCASIGLNFDGENTPEIFTLATTARQASIVFELTKTMLRQMKKDSAAIDQLTGIHRYRIWNKDNEGIMEAWSSESSAGKRDGDNPHVAIVDEYHAAKSDDLLKAAEMGMGSRRQPLTIITTTPGFLLQGPCKLFSNVCKKILAGEIFNESVFAQIYEPDEGDNWEDPEVWQKVIPNLGQAPYLDWVEEQYRKAKTEGATAEIHFKTKVLGMWVGTHSTWIEDEVWMQCVDKLPDLKGRACYGGLDLASVRDLAALTLTFPETDDEPFYQMYFFWCPEEGIRKAEKDGAVPYRAWVQDGYIEATPGNAIDHKYIISRILQLSETYDLRMINYDRYGSATVATELTEQNIPIEGFGQGFVSMSGPTKDFETVIRKDRIVVQNNPVMRWMMGNVALKLDPAGNVKITKEFDAQKVDGPVSAVMSLAAAMKPVEETAFWGFA